MLHTLLDHAFLKPLELFTQRRILRSQKICFILRICSFRSENIIIHHNISRVVERIQVVDIQQRRHMLHRPQILRRHKIAVQYHQRRLFPLQQREEHGKLFLQPAVIRLQNSAMITSGLNHRLEVRLRQDEYRCSPPVPERVRQGETAHNMARANLWIGVCTKKNHIKSSQRKYVS